MSLAVPAGVVRGAVADGLAGLLPILATALLATVAGRLARLGGTPKRWAPPLGAAVVVTTFLGPLGTSDFQEPYLALLAASALERGLVSRRLRGRRRLRALAASGLLVGAALLAKPSAIVLVPAVAAAALAARPGEVKGRGLAAAGLGLLPGLAVLLHLDVVRFGSVWEGGYSGQVSHPLTHRVAFVWTVLRLTVLPNRGLLWYAPLILLAIPGLLALGRTAARRPDRLAGLLAGGGFFAVNAFWWAWEGGMGWGPRLLAPAVACSAPLLLVRTAGARRAAFFLAAAGLLLNASGYLLDAGRVYRVVAAGPAAEPLGPVVPIHRTRAGTGELEPLQRVHYVPRQAALFVAPGIVWRLVAHGDGPAAGGLPPGSGPAPDAWVMRLLLRGERPRPGSYTGALLLQDAWVSRPVAPDRALTLARAAVAFGGPPVESRLFAGALLLGRGDASEALRLAREAALREPGNPQARALIDAATRSGGRSDQK